MKQSGIYAVTNTINGKRYVGSGVDVAGRHRTHRSHLRRNIHFNPKLQHAWNKYGEAAFRFDVLELCPPEQLIEREQYWIDTLDTVANGYNCAPIAGSCLGRRLSPEICTRYAERQRQLWERPEYRANHVAKMLETTADPTFRAQQSQTVQALWRDPDYRARQLQARRDPAWKAAQSAIVRAGLANEDPAQRQARQQRQGAQVRARAAQPEYKAAASARTRAQWTDPDYRARLIAAQNEGKARARAKKRALVQLSLFTEPPQIPE